MVENGGCYSRDNRVKVSIGSLGGWIGQEDEGDNKEEELVEVVHSGGHGKVIDSASGFLVPRMMEITPNG